MRVSDVRGLAAVLRELSELRPNQVDWIEEKAHAGVRTILTKVSNEMFRMSFPGLHQGVVTQRNKYLTRAFDGITLGVCLLHQGR